MRDWRRIILRLRFSAFPANRERQEVTWPGPRRPVCGLNGSDHDPEVIDLRQGFFLHPKTSQSHVWEDIQLFRTLFCLSINEFCIKKRTFEDNFSAKIGVSGGIKQTWQPQQPTANRPCKTGNVKPLTANPSLSFAVKRSNLDLGLQLIKRTPIWVLLMVHFLCLQRNLRCKRFSICQDIENL